jgi:hypothetical protein
MPKVKLDNLNEGMVTAAEIRNSDDMLLIPSGCELTARHIRVLKTWGIPEIQVEACGEAEDPSNPLLKLSPEQVAAIESEMRARFWRFDEANPVQQEILKLTVRRRAVQLASQPCPPPSNS